MVPTPDHTGGVAYLNHRGWGVIVTCERCYEWAEQVSLGGSMFSVTYSPCIGQHCHFLRDQLALGAQIDPANFKCPYLEAEIADQNSPWTTTNVTIEARSR